MSADGEARSADATPSGAPASRRRLVSSPDDAPEVLSLEEGFSERVEADVNNFAGVSDFDEVSAKAIRFAKMINKVEKKEHEV